MAGRNGVPTHGPRLARERAQAKREQACGLLRAEGARGTEARVTASARSERSFSRPARPATKRAGW
eukprot:11222455-Alexandrium_andersonii.AAC.1